MKRGSTILLSALFVLSASFGSINLAAQKAWAIPQETLYSATNTQLYGDDSVTTSDAPGPVNIGFTFNFYGTDYTQADISTNGVVFFSNANSRFSNGSLPSLNMGDSIMPFWDDLITDNYEAQSIYYRTVGTPGSRKFIVQWTNMSFCCTVGVPMGTFQAILYEGTNKVQFQYRDLLAGTRPQGDSATIGLNHGGTTANVFSQDAAVLNPGDAISFTPDGSGGYTSNGTPATYDPVYLYVDGLPETPVLETPSDTAANVSLTPSFTWSNSSLATSYRIVIATDNAFSNVTYNDTNVTGTTYNLSNATLDTSTTYYWRVVATNNVGYSYSDVHSFTTTAAPNNTPDTPTNVAPDALLTGQTANIVTLHGTPFTMTLHDQDASNQVGYEVQLATDASFNDTVVDYRSAYAAQGSASYTFGETGGTYLVGSHTTTLSGGQDYYFRVRAVDNQGASSNWYTPSGVAFTFDSVVPDDNDGASTSAEDAAPNAGDANNDGFPDSQQATVTSLVDPVTNHYAVLQTTGSCTSNSGVGVTNASSNAVSDSGYNYPAGMMHYTITCPSPGMTATVTQYYYGVDPTNLVVRKYNSLTKAYATIPGATVTSVTIGGQQAAKVVYQITDGSSLDEDGSANGVIVDPSGLASVVATSSTAPNTGLAQMSATPYVLTLGFGMAMLGWGYFSGRNPRKR